MMQSTDRICRNLLNRTLCYHNHKRSLSTIVNDHRGYKRIERMQRNLFAACGSISEITKHPDVNLFNPSQCRYMSSFASSLPDFLQTGNWTVWGASGYLLKTLHHDGLIPFWACMSLTNILVRTSLIPVVIQSAHTSARLANVAPEVQFLVSSFQNDYKRLKDQGADIRERRFLFRVAWKTLRRIYQLHKVNPLDIFKSPLLQIPIFWYFSIDIRKIINGLDPELAQKLTESGFLWISDLTDPDPWHGLPVLTGLLLYLNVEVAVGRQSLSGESVVKSKIAVYLKDFFQSLAIFMPCFMSQSPAGVQIYLLTSFIFTLGQSAALRYDPIRSTLGLPLMSAPPPEAKIAKEFIELKELEKKAIAARGDGELLGKGVLAPGFQASFAGTARPSTILVQRNYGPVGTKGLKFSVSNQTIPTPLMRKPPTLSLKETQLQSSVDISQSEPSVSYMKTIPDNIIESANKGERPIEFFPQALKTELKLNSKRFLKKTKK